MGTACSTHGAKRNAYIILLGKSQGKGPLVRPRHRPDYSIKMGMEPNHAFVSVRQFIIRMTK
jgi:hypothetical protein